MGLRRKEKWYSNVLELLPPMPQPLLMPVVVCGMIARIATR
jgi:hypothetical protein